MIRKMRGRVLRNRSGSKTSENKTARDTNSKAGLAPAFFFAGSPRHSCLLLPIPQQSVDDSQMIRGCTGNVPSFCLCSQAQAEKVMHERHAGVPKVMSEGVE